MRFLLILCALALGFVCEGRAQDTPSGVRTQTLAEAVLRPDLLPFAAALRVRDAEVRTQLGLVQPDTILVSIPVAYRRTAVVQSNVGEGLGILVSPRVLDAGAAGYWAGHFGVGGGANGESAWCFANQRGRTLCFIPHVDARAPASWGGPNPWMPRQLEVSTRSDAQWDSPIITEQRVEVRPDLRIEYVFRGWQGRNASIDIRVGGASVTPMEARLGLAPTPLGMLVLQQSGNRGATATLSPLPDTEAIATTEFPPPDLKSRPVPVIHAVGEIAADAAPRAISPGGDVFSEAIRPGAAINLDRGPDIVDHRFTRAAGPLAPFVINGRAAACALDHDTRGVFDHSSVRAADGRRVLSFWNFCVEDTDGDSDFDSVAGYVGAPADTNLAAFWVADASPMAEPVHLIADSQHRWPDEVLHVRYVGGDEERRFADGIRPTVALFSLSVGDQARLLPDWFVIPVQLDGSGRGALRLGGVVIARVEGVGLDGGAQIQVMSGLPQTDVALVSAEGLAQN